MGLLGGLPGPLGLLAGFLLLTADVLYIAAQRIDHGVERALKAGDFIRPPGLGADIQVAGGDFLGHAGGVAQRADDAPDDEHAQGQQQQQQHAHGRADQKDHLPVRYGLDAIPDGLLGFRDVVQINAGADIERRAGNGFHIVDLGLIALAGFGENQLHEAAAAGAGLFGHLAHVVHAVDILESGQILAVQFLARGQGHVHRALVHVIIAGLVVLEANILHTGADGGDLRGLVRHAFQRRPQGQRHGMRGHADFVPLPLEHDVLRFAGAQPGHFVRTDGERPQQAGDENHGAQQQRDDTHGYGKTAHFSPFFF